MTSAVEEAAPLQEQTGPTSDDRIKTVDAAIDFIGGVAGGTASVYVGQPLDTVKVKLQTFPTMYKNALECFTQTFRNEGFARGLYAGTVPSLAAQVSENAVLFMGYGACQRTIMFVCGKKDVHELSPLQNAASGATAGIFSSFVLCPTELVKCKLQAMAQMQSTGQLSGDLGKFVAENKVGPWSVTRNIIRTDGLKGMFRGLVPTFAREIPGYFFFFGGYEICRTLLTPPGKTKDDLSVPRTIVCGGMGGLALWLAIFPTDVIKSRVQVQVSESSGPKLGFIPLITKIIKEEGVRALYKGLGPTLLRTFPATGALFVAYETTKKLLTNLAYGEKPS